MSVIKVEFSDGDSFVVDFAYGIHGADSSIPGPKGDQGDRGPAGPQGADSSVPGPKGDQGDRGPAGPQGDASTVPGPKGDKGDVGPAGPQGQRGPTGLQGEKGDKGDVGPAGPQGQRGPTGLQGEKGDKGDQGNSGPQGNPGQDAADATRTEQIVFDNAGSTSVRLSAETRLTPKAASPISVLNGAGDASMILASDRATKKFSLTAGQYVLETHAEVNQNNSAGSHRFQLKAHSDDALLADAMSSIRSAGSWEVVSPSGSFFLSATTDVYLTYTPEGRTAAIRNVEAKILRWGGGGTAGVDATARSGVTTLEGLVGEGPLIREEFTNEILGNSQAQRVGSFIIDDTAKVAYVLQVGQSTEFILGNALRALRSGTAHAVGGGSFYSNGVGHLLFHSLNDQDVVVWKVRDITAIQAAVRASGAGQLTDAQVGDKAFRHPPANLSNTEKEAVRDAIDSSDNPSGFAVLYSANYDVTTFNNWGPANPNEDSYVLPDDAADEIWGVSIANASEPDEIYIFRAGKLGSAIDATTNPANVSGTTATNANAKVHLIAARTDAFAFHLYLGKAADGSLLIASDSVALDPSPLTLYRVGDSLGNIPDLEDLKRKAAAARALAEQNAQKIAALTTDITNSWDAFDAADVDAGYGFYAQEGTTDPIVDDEFVNPNLEWTYDVAGSLNIWLRVPKGIDPVRIRVELRRGQIVQETYPQGGQVWDNVTSSVRDALVLQYDYYHLVSETSDAGIAITGQINDRLGIEISTPQHSVVYPFDDIVSVEADGAIAAQDPVFWGGDINAVDATVGPYATGFKPTGIAMQAATNGEAAHILREGSLVNTWVGRQRSRPTLPLAVYYQETAQKLPDYEIYNPVTETWGQSNTPTTHWTTDPSRATIPEAVGVIVGTVGVDIPGSGGDYAARCHVIFNFNHLSPHIESPHIDDNPVIDTTLERRVDSVERKVADVVFDNDVSEWREITDALNPNGENYGKFMLFAGGREVRNYVGGDYNSVNAFISRYMVPANTPWNLADIGLIWVVSNTPTWSKLRLAVRSATGEFKQSVPIDAMHVVSATARGEIDNLPASGVTPLWIGHDGTHPEPFGRLVVGDTITMERLIAEPLWAGGLTGEWADRIAANEARLNVLFNSLHLSPAGRVPRTTLEITGATDWDTRRQIEYQARQADMRDDDIIEIAYENLTVGSVYQSFLQEGSDAASGKLYMHYRDIRGTVAVNGVLGFTTGLAQTMVGGNLVDDPLGSNMLLHLWRTVTLGSPHMLFEGLVRLKGSQNENTTGKFPANFSLTIRSWRS